jgi:hypothetical protein
MNEGRPMKEPLTAVQPRMAMAHLWCALPAAGRRPAATCSVGVRGEPGGGAQWALGLAGTWPGCGGPPYAAPDSCAAAHGYGEPMPGAVAHRAPPCSHMQRGGAG